MTICYNKPKIAVTSASNRLITGNPQVLIQFFQTENIMKTTSIGIANYCVPCHAHCRYCLLSSCNKTTGVEYNRSARLADRVIGELKEQKPDIPAFFYIGYCMDTPELTDYIDFSRVHNSPSASFLQMNGFAFRTDKELEYLLRSVSDAGVELIDLTIYGLNEYHDRFAGRYGDFEFMSAMLKAANKCKLPVNISIPLIRENLSQMDELSDMLSAYEVSKKTYFLPHSKGRGRSLQEQRITKDEFDRLSPEIKSSFTRIAHYTESEWLERGMSTPTKRTLTAVLSEENIDRFEKMSAADICALLEQMDDRYLQAMPSADELAERYGNPGNTQLFRERDLLLKWQQMYIDDTGKTIYDMHDETHHFSVHS